jgi:cyclic pyranopterin phosphate synthase
MDYIAKQVKMPQLRVCVSYICDKHCFYCRPEGEGISTTKKINRLSTDEFIYFINAIAKAGVSIIRFTGGEPMLNKDIYKIIKSVKSIPEVKEVSMVTRSLMLKDEANLLKQAGLDSITISLDSLNEEKLKMITKVNGLDRMIEGAYACKDIGLPVKINTVILKGVNDNEVEDFINFVGKLGPGTWKLIDYMMLPMQFGTNKSIKYFLNLNDTILPLLHKLGKESKAKFSTQAGGLGTPMPEFITPNGVKVIVRDSTIGSHYGDICKNCNLYPCQDGIMALRLTVNGKLQRCLYREDNLIDLRPYDKKTHLNQTIQKVLNTYMFSEFYPKAWVAQAE